MMKYKNYIGHVVFDDEANIFHGEVINTRDVITFQGSSVDEIQKAFKESIDDYLAFCAERGENPDKPFSGKFNLRLSPELHRKAWAHAKEKHISLNNWVIETIKKAVNE
jgi:predicted HicB family RNase H-like nuclease